MLRYLETYYKNRYLVSEIAIATGRREVTDEHWRFCADKLKERDFQYRCVTPKVLWLLTPTKVTAHRDLLHEYIPVGKFGSWAVSLLAELKRIENSPNIYFNPALISEADDFFRSDSHWTSEGARKYVEPVLASMGVDVDHLQLRLDTAIHQGNCTSGVGDDFSREQMVYCESGGYEELFQTKTCSVPDFSVKHGVNPSGKKGRGLVIHSSSYAYARGLFRSVFSSITEVFSPYVPASVISKGKFDYVIIFFAERNCAVVYNGGPFGERITKSLQVPYIQEIADELTSFTCDKGSAEEDVNFLNALGFAWKGLSDES